VSVPFVAVDPGGGQLAQAMRRTARVEMNKVVGEWLLFWRFMTLAYLRC